MTKSRTRKTTSTAKQGETTPAMDPSIREQVIPQAPRATDRVAYALTTLINEVTSLFPETTYETGGANAFNTRLVVSFDGPPDLYPLLTLVSSDPRVLSVSISDHSNLASVALHDSFRTQDSRSPFGLAEAHAILNDGGELALDDEDNFVVVEPVESDDEREAANGNGVEDDDGDES